MKLLVKQWEIEERILRLVNDRDKIPYTDIQGIAMAIAMDALKFNAPQEEKNHE